MQSHCRFRDRDRGRSMEMSTSKYQMVNALRTVIGRRGGLIYLGRQTGGIPCAINDNDYSEKKEKILTARPG